MTGAEWAAEAHRRLGKCVTLFKPKEVQAIIDFIATAEGEN